MKLAEALSIRKDLQKRIQQLEQRIKSNVKVQATSLTVTLLRRYGRNALLTSSSLASR